jgi:hypothetical protein
MLVEDRVSWIAVLAVIDACTVIDELDDNAHAGSEEGCDVLKMPSLKSGQTCLHVISSFTVWPVCIRIIKGAGRGVKAPKTKYGNGAAGTKSWNGTTSSFIQDLLQLV